MLRRTCWPAFLLLCAVSNGLTRAEEPAAEQPAAESETKFMRLVRDDAGELVSMDTAIVRYVSAEAGREGLAVDLIGAVHVGEKAYYEQLNEEFKNYDVLLYELVAPLNTRVPRGGGGGSRSMVGSLQTGMKSLLELEYQLELIDYQPENFVHADMSPEQFAESMEAKGESFWTIFFRMMGQSILQQSKQGDAPSDAEFLAALFDRNRAVKLKRIMAEQFDDLEASMAAFEGPNGSTIITERNKVALKVLAEQMAAGKQKIGIFYGAGHLPDMDQRLVDEFQLQPQEPRWLAAWDLKEKERPRRTRRAKPAPQPAEEAAEEAPQPVEAE